jgi:hypothetical protein
MEWQETNFAEYTAVEMKNSTLRLLVTVNVGPRILQLQSVGGENLLAVLPEAAELTPSGQTYRFHGGHRLWHAPEDPERSYVPDDVPVLVAPLSTHTVQFAAPVEALTGIQKTMRITLPDDSSTVIIDHILANQSAEAAVLAPWAITQLRPGGFGILPLAQEATGLLPNRRLALWPYTEITSPYIRWDDRYLFIDANMTGGKLKVGWNNPRGWLGYWRDGLLFVKKAAYQAEATYFDFGSSSECYTDPRFLELETLGPRVILPPGESVSHRETWQIFPCPDLRPEATTVDAFISEQAALL